jgi:hypothetical protein
VTYRTIGIARERVMPPVLGFVDGILNALTLAGASILHRGKPIGAGFTLRVGTFALGTAAFVLFVARYADARTELVRQSRQLNLASHGHLAETKLGRAVMREAVGDATIASVASFVGAVLPLAVATALPNHSWVAVVVAVLLLGALGVVVAVVVHGRRTYWAVALGAGGVLLSVVGLFLRIA